MVVSSEELMAVRAAMTALLFIGLAFAIAARWGDKDGVANHGLKELAMFLGWFTSIVTVGIFVIQHSWLNMAIYAAISFWMFHMWCMDRKMRLLVTGLVHTMGCRAAGEVTEVVIAVVGKQSVRYLIHNWKVDEVELWASLRRIAAYTANLQKNDDANRPQ